MSMEKSICTSSDNRLMINNCEKMRSHPFPPVIIYESRVFAFFFALISLDATNIWASHRTWLTINNWRKKKREGECKICNNLEERETQKKSWARDCRHIMIHWISEARNIIECAAVKKNADRGSFSFIFQSSIFFLLLLFDSLLRSSLRRGRRRRHLFS